MTASLLPLLLLLSLRLLPSSGAVPPVSRCADEPWGRYSMVGDFNSDGTAFYSFSGDTSSASDGLGGVVRTNWKYDLETDCWSEIPSSDVAVGYRATSVRLRDAGIVIFGGADVNYQAVDHFYIFDEDAEQLRDVTSRFPSRSSARFKHAAIAIGDARTMLVSGGRQGREVLSDVWTFSLSRGWQQVTDDAFQGDALYRHSMAWDPDTESIWAFGGLNGTFDRNGDLWRMDGGNLTGGFLKVDGTDWDVRPPGSASLGMTYFGGKIYVWGGTCEDEATLYMYTVATNTWCKVQVNDNRDGFVSPSRRDAFTWLPRYIYQGESMFITSGRRERKLEVIMAGGDTICVYNGQRAYTTMDVWKLSIEDNDAEWELLYRPYTARNRDHASAVCSESRPMDCRASISIKEDLTITSWSPDENFTAWEGQCFAPTLSPWDEGTISARSSSPGYMLQVLTASATMAAHLFASLFL